MSRKIDRIRDDRCGSVGLCRRSCKHGDGVGNAERKTAAMSAAGSNAAHRTGSINDGLADKRRMIGTIDQSNREMLTLFEMQRDVTAVVDVGAIEFRGVRHRTEYLFGDRTGYRGHRRDEMLRGLGHDDLDRRPCLDEAAAQLGRLVAGDAAGKAQDDVFAGKVVHGPECITPIISLYHLHRALRSTLT